MRIFILLLLCGACTTKLVDHPGLPVTQPSLILLGTVQDAGSPQAGCKKACCSMLFSHPDPTRMIISLGIIDPETGKRWMIEASPDFSRQLTILNNYAGHENSAPDGIFLTHAHMGHYTGLMHLGREAMNSGNTSVYSMPRMKQYLETNGPWSQLVTLNNIQLHEIRADEKVMLTSTLHVTPLLVPHRDEFSETAGYLIEGPSKKALFIPDIDKWDKWERDITALISSVDYALLDATFYDAEEIQTRDMREIPHPFVVESMVLFENLDVAEKNKIYFIHMNHTNPLLEASSEAYKQVTQKGYHVGASYTVLPL